MSTDIVPVSSLDRARFEATVTREMSRYIAETHCTNIQGKQYVTVAGASALAAGCGYSVREVGVERTEVGGVGGWVATAEIVDRSTGMVVGRGSGIVLDDEAMWKSRPQFARRAMASTRAAGRALRLSLGHLFPYLGDKVATVTLEEMPEDTK
jgi:hypothetical protein